MKWFIIAVLVGILLYLMGTHPKESRNLFKLLARIGKRIVRNIRLIFSSKHVSSDTYSKENIDKYAQIDIEIRQLKKDITNMSVQINRIKEVVNNMSVSHQEVYENLENRFSKLEKRTEELKFSPKGKTVKSIIYNSEELGAQTYQKERDQGLLYAANVDSILPLGFSVSKLSNTYSGQYFEIERISPDDALYRIVDDCKIHKQIIPTMYQMTNNGICEIENKTNSIPTYIQTSVDGRLKLKDGILVITKKAILKIV